MMDVRSHRMLSIVGVCLALMACGGQTVEPLDPRDATLPSETRQWIADAEDGVIVARARLQLMRERLTSERTTEERLADVRWAGGGAGPMSSASEQLSEARVALAEAGVAQAELSVELAKAKYKLANAERAMLHDLERYELQPLRAEAEAVRVKLRATGDLVAKQQRAVDDAERRFWQAYAGYVRGGGKTSPYWATDLAASD
ncbi:MAG: hypothetical protein OXU20_01180 [Myxococcales bacterium]|nr:hypothetical protein [Myxococcales bacterium]